MAAACVASPLVAQHLDAGSAPSDRDQLTLRARALAGAPTGLEVSPDGAVAEVLWTSQAADNATCVRSFGDLDGDGVPDAIAGHDINGANDNLFAISGTSSGTATYLWTIETIGGVSGGSFYGDDCLAPASDLTGDGVPEILGATAWGGRSANCFDGSDGSLLWQLDTYSESASGWVYTIREIPDVTGDGVPEAVFGCGSSNDSVYCVDGASRGTPATVLWSYKARDAVFAVGWVPDINGDGIAEVVVGTGDYDGRIYCLAGDTGVPLWIHDPDGTIMSLATVSDVDGDGRDDVVAAVWNATAGAVCVSSMTGNRLWTHGAVGGNGMKVAALPDVSGDGVDEVLVGSWNNAILCLDGATGARRWSTPTGTKNGGDVWTLSAMPDVNGDTLSDAVAGSFDGLVYGVDGRTGAVLWTQDTGNRVYSASWMNDVDGDGKPEAIAGTQDTVNNVLVYGIAGDSGLTLPYLARSGAARPGGVVELHSNGLPGDAFIVFGALGTASLPVVTFGTLLLDPATLFQLSAGAVPGTGTGTAVLPLPASPALVGVTLYFQSLVGADPRARLAALTNRVQMTIE